MIPFNRFPHPCKTLLPVYMSPSFSVYKFSCTQVCSPNPFPVLLIEKMSESRRTGWKGRRFPSLFFYSYQIQYTTESQGDSRTDGLKDWSTFLHYVPTPTTHKMSLDETFRLSRNVTEDHVSLFTYLTFTTTLTDEKGVLGTRRVVVPSVTRKWLRLRRMEITHSRGILYSKNDKRTVYPLINVIVNDVIINIITRTYRIRSKRSPRLMWIRVKGILKSYPTIPVYVGPTTGSRISRVLSLTVPLVYVTLDLK